MKNNKMYSQDSMGAHDAPVYLLIKIFEIKQTKAKGKLFRTSETMADFPPAVLPTESMARALNTIAEVKVEFCDEGIKIVFKV